MSATTFDGEDVNAAIIELYYVCSIHRQLTWNIFIHSGDRYNLCELSTRNMTLHRRPKLKPALSILRETGFTVVCGVRTTSNITRLSC